MNKQKSAKLKKSRQRKKKAASGTVKTHKHVPLADEPVKKTGQRAWMQRLGFGFILIIAFVAGNAFGRYIIPTDVRLQLKKQILRVLPVDTESQPDVQDAEPTPSLSSFKSAVVTVGDVELVPPGPDSTQEDQEKFEEDISRVAVESDTVTIIHDCTLDPVVTRAERGNSVIFESTIDEDRIVIIGSGDGELEVNAGETARLEAELRGTGIYGLACKTKGIQGFLQIVNSTETD